MTNFSSPVVEVSLDAGLDGIIGSGCGGPQEWSRAEAYGVDGAVWEVGHGIPEEGDHSMEMMAFLEVAVLKEIGVREPSAALLALMNGWFGVRRRRGRYL